MKKVFTTGQVAKICKVAPDRQQVVRFGPLAWISNSQARKTVDIPREHLLRFLKEHGMPLGISKPKSITKILVESADAPMLGSLREQLREGDDFRIETAASGFEAGIRAESFHPDLHRRSTWPWAGSRPGRLPRISARAGSHLDDSGRSDQR